MRALILAIAGLALLATPAAADADLATLERWSPVAAYKGTVAWSTYRPTTNDYVLTIRTPAGEAAAAPIAPSSAPFDVDLGPDEKGRTVAVFSRCKGPPAEPASIGFPPRFSPGTRCDVHRYDPATRSERAIPIAARPGEDESLPAIWGRTLVWVERGRALRTRPTDGTTPERGLAAGPSGEESRIGHPDVEGRRVAFPWFFEKNGWERTSIRVDDLTGGQRVVAQAWIDDLPPPGDIVWGVGLASARVAYVRQSAYRGWVDNVIVVTDLKGRGRDAALPWTVGVAPTSVALDEETATFTVATHYPAPGGGTYCADGGSLGRPCRITQVGIAPGGAG